MVALAVFRRPFPVDWWNVRRTRPVEVFVSDVTIYWRPGCGFCARLKDTISAVSDNATWLNIWQDEDAAAFVRSVNNGNEVVPTVVIDGEAHTNPDPDLVLAALTE